MTEPAAPTLAVRAAAGATTAVALVLPGGAEDSFDPVGRLHLAGIRMAPFALALHRREGQAGLAVWTLRYRVRGWNGTHMSPVHDAEWALAEVARRHGDVPVVLVGHSMGGRTAMRVAGHPLVRAVVGLAPWLPDGEPVEQLAGRRLLVAHGTWDRVTSPRSSEHYVERARAVAEETRFVRVEREMHAMLFRPLTWQRLVTSYVAEAVARS